MEEIIEKLIELTQNDEITWLIDRDNIDFVKYRMICEKLKKFDNLELALNIENGNITFDSSRFIWVYGIKTKYYWMWQKELQRLLETIESKTDYIQKFKEWIDNYDKLVIKKTSHTWKLPDDL